MKTCSQKFQQTRRANFVHYLVARKNRFGIAAKKHIHGAVLKKSEAELKCKDAPKNIYAPIGDKSMLPKAVIGVRDKGHHDKANILKHFSNGSIGIGMEFDTRWEGRDIKQNILCGGNGNGGAASAARQSADVALSQRDRFCHSQTHGLICGCNSQPCLQEDWGWGNHWVNVHVFPQKQAIEKGNQKSW